MPIVFILLAFLLVLPADVEAQYRGGWDINRDRLDDEIVEEFHIPLLFGLRPVVPDYGAPRGGGTRLHEGQDFFAPKWSPIVSPTEAIVIRTGVGVSAGKYVYTANSGGETFRYMHLDEIADIKRGDRLKVGDLIGLNGQSGNAEGTTNHLHFEVRDENNDDTDPYPRLDGEFSLREKISFLDQILDGYDGDEDEYAEFLAKEFRTELAAGLRAGYDMPREIERALRNEGVVEDAEREAALAETLALIPQALAGELEVGDQGLLVTLLQIYVIYTSEGEARDRLLAAGPTGYYGSITAAAVRELQDDLGVDETGVYDRETRLEALERDPVLTLS